MLNNLRPRPASAVRWSVLCPSGISPRSKEIREVEKGNSLVAKAEYGPLWTSAQRYRSIPIVGGLVECIAGMAAHMVYFEDLADFMAADLAGGSDEWAGKLVGIGNAEKSK